MAGIAKRRSGSAGTAKAAPASARPSEPVRKADAKDRAPAPALSIPAKPAPASKTSSSKSAKALPVRSSPVGTAPSLRSSLEKLHSEPSRRKASVPASKAAASAAPFVRKPVLQELEARLLMSADLNPAAQETLLATPAMQGAEFRALADPAAPTVVTSMQVAPIHRTNELVFVDTAVPEYQKLVEEMRAAAVAEGRNLEFVLIEQGKDGIRKITDTLAQKSGLDAIHVLSHGDAGSLQLGAATLDFDALVQRASAIKKWGDALTDNGDLLIYGCDLAATQEGKSLIDALARLTGADVAASEDLTGAAAKGGDWDLEFKSGAIEAAVAVGQVAQAGFEGVLQQAVAQGGETRANTSTGNTQFVEEGASKQVAVAADGSFVVAWVSQNQDGSGTGVYAQRFAANGTTIGAEIPVNQTTANDQREPAVAIDAAGNFVVMWNSGNGANNDIYARRFSAAGAALGNEFQVNTTSAGNQRAGGIAMTADGRFVIGWASESGQDGSGIGAYIRLYDAAGNATTGEVQVNTTIAGDQHFDSVAMDAAGNVVVVGTGDNIDGDGQGVYGQRFDASGNRVGGQFVVNTQNVGNQSYASVAMAADGRFAVSWTDYNGTGADVFYELYDADGISVAGGVAANTTLAGNQEYSTVAMDANGNFTVTWSSFGQDLAGTYGIYKQDFHTSGFADGAETLVNTTVGGDQLPPSIGMNAWGEYVVAWDGNGPGDATGVFFQRYTGSLIVDTATDNVDGNTTSITTLIQNKGADGFISLREAIIAANNTPNTQPGSIGPDRIYFRIGGAYTTGVKTINVADPDGAGPLTPALPAITDAVLLDAQTQSGFGATPLIELNGAGAGAGAVGLTLSGANSTVRGFTINRFAGTGITVTGGLSTITGNWIGLNNLGTAASANGVGIRIDSNTNVIGGNTALERNVISGNTTDGIFINGRDNNVIQGNYIGTNAAGAALVPM